MRILDFADGFESNTQPTIVGVSASSIAVTPTGSIASTNVQAALAELDSEKVAKVTATDNAVTRFDGTTGVVQNSDVIVDDDGNVSGIGDLDAAGDLATGGAADITGNLDVGGNADIQGDMVVRGDFEVQGTTVSINTTNTDVEDKLITINKGGTAGSGGGSGLEIEEDGVITGYSKTSSDRNSLEIKAPNTAGITKITPGSSNDEVALLAKAQSLSNKTFTDEVRLSEISTPSTPSAGVRKLYPKSDGKIYHLGSDGVEKAVGSGSGSGKNYLSDLFEGSATTGINQYADSGATPTDGTGGSPAGLTTALNSSTPLRGTSSQRLSKDGSDRQGSGWSVDFTLDRADYEAGKALNIQFSYKTSSNYASGDVKVFIYDKDGTTLQTVVSANGDGSIPKSTDSSVYSAAFYPNPANNDYRMVLHITSTNASAWDLDLIDLSVGPGRSIPGAILTEWQSYIPTFTGFGTTSSVNVRWRRNGSDLEVEGSFTTGTVTATEGRISFPTGLVSSSTIPTLSVAGIMVRPDTGGFSLYVLKEPSVSYMTFGIQSSGTIGYQKANVSGALAGSSYAMSFKGSFPIQGWTASAALSSTETLMSTVKASYVSTATQSLADSTGTIIDFQTVRPNAAIGDRFGAVTTGASWKFTAPKTAWYSYFVKIGLTSSGGWNAGEPATLEIYKNGSRDRLLDFYTAETSTTKSVSIQGSGMIYLVKGDYIDFRGQQNSGGSITLIGSGDHSFVDVIELPDFSVFSQYNTVDRQYNLTTSGPSGWSAGRCVGIPYLTADGSWRLKFNIQGTLTAASSVAVQISGVTFKNASNYQQACVPSDNTASRNWSYCRANPNANTITTVFSGNTTDISLSGDVELDSKPTFVP